MKLTDEEKLLSKPILVYKWLVECEIDFTDITSAYVSFLETKNKRNNVLVSGLAIPLTSYFNGVPKSQKTFIQSKAAYNLIKSNLYSGTQFEKELKECVDKSGYSEDEDGVHTIEETK